MKRITGVSERLLECARDEFLDKGFQSASIRDIAKKANTSARAVYTRFPNKEGLFDAIVLPISDGLVELYQNYADQFCLKNKENRSAAFASIDDTAIYLDMIDYIYDHRDEFLLLQCSLDGTRQTTLIDKLTEINLSYVYTQSNIASMSGTDEDLMRGVLHMLTNSFYSSMFEPLRHGKNRCEARFYIDKLCVFFVAGISYLIKG